MKDIVANGVVVGRLDDSPESLWTFTPLSSFSSAAKQVVAMEKPMSGDQEETRALLIEMRIYVMHHGLPIGECVAWNKLKAKFGVGDSNDADIAWLREELLRVIHEVHGQHADDLCWMDIDKIFAAAGLPVPDRRVGDQEAMLANCHRFVPTMCRGGKWRSYAELEAENYHLLVGLKAMVKAAEDAIDFWDTENELKIKTQAILYAMAGKRTLSSVGKMTATSMLRAHDAIAASEKRRKEVGHAD